MKLFTIIGLSTLLIVMVFVNTAISQQEDFLVGYWPFEEGKGDEAIDESGSGNDGHINGNVKWVEGKFDKALEFEPGADVTIPDSDSLRDMTEFAAAMWLYIHSIPGGWCHLLEKDGSYGLTINGDTKTFRYSPNSSQVWVESDVKVSMDRWYYLTMVWDGSKVLFYVDGKKVSESSEAMVFNNNAVNIAHPPGYTVDGIIDEVKIWKKSLTEAEVNIAMEGNATITLSPNGLAITWGKLKSGH